MKPSPVLVLALFLMSSVAGATFADPSGAARGSRHGVDAIRRWNAIALEATGLDHTPVPPGDPRVFGEELGPGRAARAMAIAHIAMFDAIDEVVGGYESYAGVSGHRTPISIEAAVAQAGHDTLAALYPSQAAAFDAELADELGGIENRKAKANGVELGSRTASAILSMRVGDGAEVPEPLAGVGHLMSDMPGHWRVDPISHVPVALGARWGECVPFVMRSGSQFRVPPPPPMGSTEYADAYAEAKALGGDGVTTPTSRTAEQTQVGLYWAYDGTPSLCAPPRLYNQIALHLADQMHSTEIEVARLLALVNVSLADAGMAVWDSKYYYDFWRPVTGIRESDAGTGPTGLGDDNPATVGDATFTPLGAPLSNRSGPNFTPPFPAYPSGHAGFGGALFQTLRRFYGRDDIAFTFVSDELNGVTRDNAGNVRPLVPRSFTSFSQAEEENGQSRIYLGIHWSFDKTAGIAEGRQVGDWTFDHAFRPIARGHH